MRRLPLRVRCVSASLALGRTKDKLSMPSTAISPLIDGSLPSSGTSPLSRSARAWALYQGARDPSNMVINIYIFMPYFASIVVGNPVDGQAAVARIGTATGWIIALTAPLLGVALDRLGPRKPLLAVITVAQVLLLASLWFVAPGAGLPLIAAELLLVTIGRSCQT